MSNKFHFASTSIDGLIEIAPIYIKDERGYFMKSFEKNIFERNGITFECNEEFQTYSKKGVLRGLHFQTSKPQDKIVRVINGEAFDVAVDLRKNSITYGKWLGFYLSEYNKKIIYIPKGFAHGFLSLTDGMIFSYICGAEYSPDTDGGIRWDDPDINIKWPLDKIEKVIISEKDKNLQFFHRYDTDYFT